MRFSHYTSLLHFFDEMMSPTLDPTSPFADEADAAMCLLSMKAMQANLFSNPESDAIPPSDHQFRPIQHAPHATNQIMPRSLFTPRDSQFLSPLQCYIRNNCIEYFEAGTKNGSGYVARGRQTCITAGRVGIRCRFCKHATERVSQSTSFPTQIDKLYSAASMIQCRHFPKCDHIPKKVADELARLKMQGNGSTKMQKVSAS